MTALTEDEKLAGAGWIKHDGKGMPVPSDTVVNVLLRGFANKESRKAGEWVWYDCGDSTITHYRIASPNTDRAQIEALGKVADVPGAMTLRDQFAMHYGAAIVTTSPHWPGAHDAPECAVRAYAFADAMLAERARK